MYIDKIIYPGYGLAKDKNGRAVFVHKAVAGDNIVAKIIKSKKNYSFGVINKIISSSQLRIEPICPYFEQCGGCEHQNISYNNQLKMKQSIIKEILDHAKIDLKPENIKYSKNNELFYRNSIRFFFYFDKNNNVYFCRHHFYKNQYVIVDHCYLHSNIANQILLLLKDYINKNISHKGSFWQIKFRQGKNTNDFMVELITTSEYLPNKSGIISVLKSIPEIKSIYHTIAPNKSLKQLRRHLIFGSPIIYEKIGKYKFQISPSSFFQTNSLGAEILYEQIKKYADVNCKQQVLDLYCGTGTIAIYLSTTAKSVIGVDLETSSINDARGNAKINHIHNCQFQAMPVERYLSETKNNCDIIVVDPPRAGLSKNIIDLISKIKFKKLIYASCNPSTFVRDILIFKEKNIKPKSIQPIDNFPQTHHLELVGLLTK